MGLLLMIIFFLLGLARRLSALAKGLTEGSDYQSQRDGSGVRTADAAFGQRSRPSDLRYKRCRGLSRVDACLCGCTPAVIERRAAADLRDKGVDERKECIQHGLVTQLGPAEALQVGGGPLHGFSQPRRSSGLGVAEGVTHPAEQHAPQDAAGPASPVSKSRTGRGQHRLHTTRGLGGGLDSRLSSARHSDAVVAITGDRVELPEEVLVRLDGLTEGA